MDEGWIVAEDEGVARRAPPNNGMHQTANQRASHR
jgi:hypothetical protein